jgi:arginyl-tRNA synthetase
VLFKKIEQDLQAIVSDVCPDISLEDIVVRKCPVSKFGDYQCNSLMGMVKRSGGNPREVAAEVVKRLSEQDQLCDQIEVAGPGFINFRLKVSALESILNDSDLGSKSFVSEETKPRTFIVDFSSPNVAKPMHVGHIRSTFLGDSLCRILRFVGHEVISDNHIGDWGTQFGKLIVGWKKELDSKALELDALGEMERLYRRMNHLCENDPGVLEEARLELLKLQQGDEENLSIWREMIELSTRQFDEIYSRLGVKFDETLGESQYNDRLNALASEMERNGLAERSQGALVIFFPDDSELKDHPAMIQKSDGAANYTTTDLATLEYRKERWSPDEILYVTDGRQQLHFKQLFRAYQRWNTGQSIRLEHTWFGSIMGKDGKPFKTRSGEVVKLTDLLNEAEERTRKIVEEKNPDLDESQKAEIARIVGIGAIKYADLLPNRQSDYVFDWDTMLALKGNTAPYLQYAYTRIQGIFRKAGVDVESVVKDARIRLQEEEEVDLSKHLVNFPLVLQMVLEEYRPNYLCTYLFELAGHFSRFYEKCPILKADGEVRGSRLRLVRQAGDTLRQGLGLLGIEVTDVM